MRPVCAGTQLISAVFVTALISVPAFAQSLNPVQGITQIVRAADRKDADRSPQEHKSPEPPGPTTKIRPGSSEQALVVPPGPNISKKNAGAISVPAEAAKGTQRYEERAATASTVSIGSEFGYRRDPFTRRSKFHSGVDIKAKLGDSVGASCGGVVQYAGWYHGYGNIVIVDHGGGITTHYAHLSAFDVEVGDRVERGTVVGRAGSTGRATSPHLHYEVRVDGSAVNPLQALALDPSSEYFKKSQPLKQSQPAQPAAETPKHPLKAN